MECSGEQFLSVSARRDCETPHICITDIPCLTHQGPALQPPASNRLTLFRSSFAMTQGPTVIWARGPYKHILEAAHGFRGGTRSIGRNNRSILPPSMRTHPDSEAPMARLTPEQTFKSSYLAGNSGIAPRVRWLSFGVGLVSFVATELMHYLLVPNIGRRWERLLAEGVSAFVVSVLVAKLMHASNQRREATLLRMQVISEMNHHVRNALAAISLSTDAIQNQQCIRVISESVDRIEWALREVLLRPKPLIEKQRSQSRHVQRQSQSHHSSSARQENTNESRSSTLR